MPIHHTKLPIYFHLSGSIWVDFLPAVLYNEINNT